MNTNFSKDHNIVRSTLDRYLRTHYRFEERNSRTHIKDGFDPNVWKNFGELGLTSLSLEEINGGLGGQCKDVTIVCELLGYHLVTEPLILSSILCGDLIQTFGTDSQLSRHLPSIASAGGVFSFAHLENDLNWGNLEGIQTRAAYMGAEGRLNGRKLNVNNAINSTYLLISASVTSDENGCESPTLFVVDTNSKGVSLDSYTTLDGANAATVTLNNVQLSREDCLDARPLSSDELHNAVRKSVLCLSAEATGIASRLLEETWAHARNRRQFGSMIGDFQVIQHRLADMYMAYEEAKSFVWVACELVDSSSRDMSEVLPSMRRKVSSACRGIAEAAIQIHGGIGTTHELIVGPLSKKTTRD